MKSSRDLWRECHSFLKCMVVIAAMFFVALPGCAQSAPAGQQPGLAWAQNVTKDPELLAEFGRLLDKFQHNIKPPEARGESRLLPLLPAGTMAYGAFSNYGDVADQALKIFRQELQESASLRAWWEHGELRENGPKIESFLEKFHQLHTYLGDEIVVSGVMKGQNPSLLLVAEVRKPGLKKFLENLIGEMANKSKPDVRVLDLKELANAEDHESGKKFTVLVRTDFVVAGFDLSTVRNFNAQVQRGVRQFASAPFGQRILKEYQGGVMVLAGADLQKVINQDPANAKLNALFQQTGFADVKYLVWANKSVEGRAISQTELSFNGPRHSAASWLAKPAPLGGLDFVSPKAILAGSMVLKNPAEIFEDVKELAGTPNSGPFAAIESFEQALKLSVKDDLLGLLTGEVTLELDSFTAQQPVWKAILSVNDAGHLQQTFETLLAAGHFETEQAEDGGVTYHTVRIPISAKNIMNIGYAFVDGYLIIGSSRDVVADAIELHKSGGSLAKSKKFLASLPPGHSLKASALWYKDPMAMAALGLRQLAPDIAESLKQAFKEAAPSVVCVDGDETAIREVSTSPSVDAGVVLIVAAVAIPNLLRSRMAANEASAVGTVRTINTAQVTYAATYPEKGFARNLATLGVDPHAPTEYSPVHAGLIDESLANESCTGDGWCTKSGYRFRISTPCKQRPCMEYVVVATPVDSNSGTQSFCSTEDGVIRSQTGPPLTSPLSASECKAWAPLQ